MTLDSIMRDIEAVRKDLLMFERKTACRQKSSTKRISKVKNRRD